MFSVSDKQYIAWQEKLKTSVWFRRFWTFWGIYIVGFYYAGTVLFFFPQTRQAAVLALAAFLPAKFVLSLAISFACRRTRPYQKLNFFPPSRPWLMSRLHNTHNSMPSTHAASLAAISTACFMFYPPLGVLGFLTTFFNGIGRIILGYHYPSDVLAGWLVGAFSALAAAHFIAPFLIK